MRASLPNLRRILRSDRVPAAITQQPFDGDPGHYQRLCQAADGEPGTIDLVNYAQDMQYMELQPDLLRHLLPVLLRAWRRDLFEGDAVGYGLFTEEFWSALAKGAALTTLLREEEAEEVGRFMGDSILDRMDEEKDLSFAGARSSPYAWVSALLSYGIVFPRVETLWSEWWSVRTNGHALAAFQFASALLYEDEENPVFAPWNGNQGGGCPSISCGACHISELAWKPENIEFLSRTFTVEFVESRLREGWKRLVAPEAQATATRMLKDFPRKAELLAMRIEELPNLLSDSANFDGFSL